jgi:hypothetical protein
VVSVVRLDWKGRMAVSKAGLRAQVLLAGLLLATNPIVPLEPRRTVLYVMP